MLTLPRHSYVPKAYPGVVLSSHASVCVMPCMQSRYRLYESLNSNAALPRHRGKAAVLTCHNISYTVRSGVGKTNALSSNTVCKNTNSVLCTVVFDWGASLTVVTLSVIRSISQGMSLPVIHTVPYDDI